MKPKLMTFPHQLDTLITKISENWWRLDVGHYPDRITFFDFSVKGLIGKYQTRLREQKYELLPRVDRSSYKINGGFYG
jgi:hypothetical protein